MSQFHLLGEPHDDTVATPPIYMAFDLLYRERRRALLTAALGFALLEPRFEPPALTTLKGRLYWSPG